MWPKIGWGAAIIIGVISAGALGDRIWRTWPGPQTIEVSKPVHEVASRTETADLTIAAPTGSTNFHATGKVDLPGTTGPLKITGGSNAVTGTGSVELHPSTGTITLDSQSGQVTLNPLVGKLTLQLPVETTRYVSESETIQPTAMDMVKVWIIAGWALLGGVSFVGTLFLWFRDHYQRKKPNAAVEKVLLMSIAFLFGLLNANLVQPEHQHPTDLIEYHQVLGAPK